MKGAVTDSPFHLCGGSGIILSLKGQSGGEYPDRDSLRIYQWRMMVERSEWTRAKDSLVRSITDLGFAKELGDEIAKNLGSSKAMQRMEAYLKNVKPRKIELVVDEMLAIRSDIDNWHDKKAAEEANARYNELLYYGLEQEEGS